MRLSANVFRYRYHNLRPWLVQPFFWALFFISPWLDWFRVDMIGQKIIFFGHAYPFQQQYIQWIPILFYAIVLLIAVMSVILGRVFCGWSCPHNTLTEWTRPLRAMVGREAKPRWLKHWLHEHPKTQPLLWLAAPILAILLTLGLTFSLASFIVPPQWIMHSYQIGQPHIALVFGQGLFTLIGLFLLFCGHDFCRTCCPYGMGQSISAYMGGKWKPMEIRFTGDTQAQCKSCQGCQTACPVDIDPRDPKNLFVGQFQGCFNCGECIDACKYIQGFQGHTGLLRFNAPTTSQQTVMQK